MNKFCACRRLIAVTPDSVPLKSEANRSSLNPGRELPTRLVTSSMAIVSLIHVVVQRLLGCARSCVHHVISTRAWRTSPLGHIPYQSSPFAMVCPALVRLQTNLPEHVLSASMIVDWTKLELRRGHGHMSARLAQAAIPQSLQCELQRPAFRHGCSDERVVVARGSRERRLAYGSGLAHLAGTRPGLTP